MKRIVWAPLLFLAAGPARAQNPSVSITVDVAANRHDIDPRIYGVNNAGAAALSDLNLPLNRLGGTFASRYNWNVDAYNRGDDYFFLSIVETDFAAPGKTADNFIAATKGASAEPVMTMPMVGQVAKVQPNGDRLCSFPTSLYAGQQQVADGCGNGILDATGQPIVGNDPLLANVAADHTFQQGWVQHLVGQFGTAANGGLRYYGYDNEPAIWHVSHRDVHPGGAGMEEVRDKTIAYGHMIKTEDPGAILVGPEEYNWDGYFSSGVDIKYYGDNDCSNNPCVFPDRAAHGGADYLPWLLGELNQHETDSGERVLDVFAVHFYPQGDLFGHNEFVNNVDDAVDNATQLLRNRSTRNLWDPSYMDESYIGTEGIDGGHDQLIPRFKGWVATYYPGTLTGLTEYSWGADNSMNGATAQADILGIFGREGLDLAARWEVPPAGSPVYKAFQIYRNYDGAKSTFGDVSVRAKTSSATEADAADRVAAFAAERSSDGALTIMVVSKALSGNTPATLDVQNFGSGSSAMAWRLRANTLGPIDDVAVSGGLLSLTLPPQSVTLLVLPNGPTLAVADTSGLEAASGSTKARFKVELSGPAAQEVRVDYGTADGTAQAGLDYVAVSGTLTFDPGVTEREVEIEILDDALKEPNETFTLVLSNAAGAAVARAVATLTIVDNSVAPKLQFSLPAYVVSEAAKQAVITVRRLGSLKEAASVDYAAFDGTALSPADYSPLAAVAGTLSFPAGAGSRTFVVPLVGDAVPEGDETVLFRLTDPVGALLGSPATAVLTIRDNDPAGALSVSPASLRLTEAAGQAKLTVRRQGGANGTVTVDYATADGSAQDGSDYTGQAGTLTFAPGQVAQTITVPVLADGLPDGEEYFRLSLSNPTGGARLGTGPSAIVTLTSTDTAVQFVAPAYAASEAAAQANIVVKRTGSLAQGLEVDYLASDGTALVAVDYLAASGTLTFPPGVFTRSFGVKLIKDPVFRAPRTVNLGLSGPSVGDLGTSQAVLTIKDADAPGRVELAAADVTVSESAGAATVKVVRTGKLAAGQTVQFTTSDGTAAAGAQYTDSSQILTFALGEKFKTVSIPILDDGAPGGAARSVKLELSSPGGGATVGTRGAATLWIVEAE